MRFITIEYVTSEGNEGISWDERQVMTNWANPDLQRSSGSTSSRESNRPMFYKEAIEEAAKELKG